MFFCEHHRHYIKAKLKAKTALAEVSHYSGYNMMNTHLTLVLSGIVIKTARFSHESSSSSLRGSHSRIDRDKTKLLVFCSMNIVRTWSLLWFGSSLIRSKYGKIRITKNCAYAQFSRTVLLKLIGWWKIYYLF